MSELRSRASRALWGPKDNRARFWAKVDKDGPPFEDRGPCWLWTGARTRAGYGSLTRDGTRCYAHRIAYEDIMGPLPPKHELHHLCQTPTCVNPGHFEVLTKREHSARTRGAAVGYCNRGHDLADARIDKRGKRHCRRCERDRVRARRAALAEQAHGQ